MSVDPINTISVAAVLSSAIINVGFAVLARVPSIAGARVGVGAVSARASV